MTKAISHAAPDDQTDLLRQVGSLCHAIRWIAVGWIAWALIVVVHRWSDVEAIKRGWGRLLGRDLAALPAMHHAAAFAAVLADWAVSAAVVVFVWRLFGCYLRGSIITDVAATQMRNLGMAGVAAVIVDMLVRPLVGVVLTWHLSSGAPRAAFWVEPNDILHVLMALFVVAVAYIQRSGAALADDNRLIV